MSIPKRVESRIKSGLKKYKPILDDSRKADRSEEDTVTIVRDMLADVLGYDKYKDITGEYQIRGTYCDLAVKVDDRLRFLIEVKAVDKTLKESHIRQATDYAAKEGIEWVVLTNGIEWHIFRMIYEKPVRHEFVFSMDMLSSDSDLIEQLYLLSKEGAKKRAIRQYYAQVQALNRYSIAAAIISEPVLRVISREIKRASPGIRIDMEDVEEIIMHEVVKRDVLDSPQVQDAVKRIKKASSRKLRDRKASTSTQSSIAKDSSISD